MEHVKKRFDAVNSDGEYSIRITAHVISGRVIDISECIQYSSCPCNPNVVYFCYERLSKEFERNFIDFINKLYKFDKEVYEEFVAALDDETLRKYFKKFYVPK